MHMLSTHSGGPSTVWNYPIALTRSSDSVGVPAMERNSVFSGWRAMAMYVRPYSVRPDLGRERTENLRRGRARLGALGIPDSERPFGY